MGLSYLENTFVDYGIKMYEVILPEALSDAPNYWQNFIARRYPDGDEHKLDHILRENYNARWAGQFTYPGHESGYVTRYRVTFNTEKDFTYFVLKYS